MTLMVLAPEPSEIVVESKQRIELIVGGDDDLITRVPYFAFTEWTERPTQWYGGQWGTRGRFIVAQSPIIGQRPVLTPGIWQVWIRVDIDGESIIKHTGRLRVR